MTTLVVSDFQAYFYGFGIPIGAALLVLLWSVWRGKRD